MMKDGFGDADIINELTGVTSHKKNFESLDNEFLERAELEGKELKGALNSILENSGLFGNDPKY